MPIPVQDVPLYRVIEAVLGWLPRKPVRELSVGKMVEAVHAPLIGKFSVYGTQLPAQPSWQ